MAICAQSFLERVIKTIRMRAMNSHLVDWDMAQKAAQEMCPGAKTTKDTYDAINYVLSLLQDNHSFLRDRSGRGTRKHGTQERPRKQERVKRDALVVDDGKTFGFIRIPSFSGSELAAHKFAQGIQDEIRAAVDKQAVGWIVDLRGNGGGNMWPMLKGAGPLIGEGVAGHFCYPRVSIAWYYEGGSVGVINRSGKQKDDSAKIENLVPDHSHQPLVVLIDRNTASSGEAVAISFKGRPRSYFVGKATAGLATNNESIKLPDGATLLLTTSCESDRNGIRHFPDVKPDLEIIQGDIAYGAKDDPGILAAIEWLRAETQA